MTDAQRYRENADVVLFPTALIDDMRKSFEVACAKLGLAPPSDKATALVVTKIVELANAGRRGDELTVETLRYFGVREPERRGDRRPPQTSPGSSATP